MEEFIANYTKIREELFILSRMRNTKLLWSMGMADRLDKYKPGDEVPFFEGGEQIGKTKIPDDFYKLIGLGSRMDIKVPTEVGRDVAYDVIISGFDRLEISAVLFTWGLITGIASLSFVGRNTYECIVPDDFTIEKLVALVKSGKIKEFVLENAYLTKGQRAVIEKQGL